MEKIKAFFKETGGLFKTHTGSMIFVIAAAFILSALIFGGGGDSTAPDVAKDTVQQISDAGENAAEVSEPTQPEDKSKGNLGNYYVEILSCEKAADWSGDNAIIVTYTFTNNSAEGQAFCYAVADKAFQNGVQLELALCDNCDSTNEVLPGYSTTVRCAYKLTDDSPVLVICEELFSLGSTKLEKTFDIA